MGQRLALVIGNCIHEDSTLTQLNAPDIDVDSLVEVLRDKDIGGFDEVIPLVNENHPKVSKEIARFFNRKKRDDLLLLYYSGHGIRDNRGRLYLAVRDTERDLLSATAIPAAYITDVMDGCLSKRKVLVLDCCHSGAFGVKGIIGTSAGTASEFEGSGTGKVVLTASDSTQYAWEGDRVIGAAENSVFTHFLIQGLRTGDADSDTDGMITLDELYNYVYEQVIDVTPNQTPEKWSYKQHGEIVIAYARRLSPELHKRLDDPNAYVRLGALLELRSLLFGDDAQLSGLAADALHRMVDDDSRQVSVEAKKILEKFERGTEISAGAVEESQLETQPRNWKNILSTPWVLAAIIGVIVVGGSILSVPLIRDWIASSAPSEVSITPDSTETALAAAVPSTSSLAQISPSVTSSNAIITETSLAVGAIPTATYTPSRLAPLTETPLAAETSSEISDDFGVEMLLVPAGEFDMGSESGESDELPVHKIWLDDFYIDKYEVTNALYAECIDAFICSPPSQTNSSSRSDYYGNALFSDYPVIYVSWENASQYCEWRGGRLPTEAEWEKSARGSSNFQYPWGNTFDGTLLNFCDSKCVYEWKNTAIDDGYGDTAPVGSYPAGASSYGVLDMSGNVLEWVADWYASDYFNRSQNNNPQGPASGVGRVLRGGSFSDTEFNTRTTTRLLAGPSETNSVIGFRCARSVTLPMTTPQATLTPSPVSDASKLEVPMVLVPAGRFEMGNEDGELNESPVHSVSLDDFYIDIYEVTNELFARFLNEMGNQEQGGATWLEVDRSDVRIHQIDGTWKADTGYANHPVVKVTWNGARAFCEWLGESLPTEAQWEKAARGGLLGALYPWGDEPPLCQQGAPNGAKFDDDAGCNDTGTESVGSYNPNGYGLFDMAGNAWEWVQDWYTDSFYAESPVENPTGPASGVVHVIRGGSAYDPVYHLRVAGRVKDNPNDRLALIGFRCARSP